MPAEWLLRRCPVEMTLGEEAARDLEPRIDDARAFAQANQVLLLRHAPSGVDVDVSLAWLPFELEAINAADKLTVGEVRVPVARPEFETFLKLLLVA
jgi:hypothetical protein